MMMAGQGGSARCRRLQLTASLVQLSSDKFGIVLASFVHCLQTIPKVNIHNPKNRKKSKKSKLLGMIRDALGGIRGSSLSIFTGFS